jgi:putative membrane protein
MKKWNRWEKGFFAAFLFWSVMGLIFSIGHITIADVVGWSIPAWLRGFIELCLQYGDPILILLAFANTHLHAAKQWGHATARRWGLIVIVGSYAVETLGVSTGFPFGSYQYTDRFGTLVGAVPFTIPFAWHVVVTNALFIVRMVAPYLSKAKEVALAALLCTVYDFILEPFATHVKGYWIWSNGIPLTNYVAWFVISGLLLWFFAPTQAVRYRKDPRPWLILGIMVLIFLAGRWV